MALPGRELRSLHLFAGAGGGILADLILGHRPVCAVEFADYPRRVLLARQRDGHLPQFPIWDDVCTFDGKPWRGRVDIVAGGFPCQDISAAGKGEGLDGARSGLWSEMARIVGEVRPRFAFVENSPILTSRGLGVVLGDLAALGYDAEWGVLGARDAGAPQIRKRVWVLAHTPGVQCDVLKDNARGVSRSSAEAAEFRNCDNFVGWRTGDRWAREPDVGRVAHGVADGIHRLKALGNGQVPQCAALAWRVLSARLGVSC